MKPRKHKRQLKYLKRVEYSDVDFFSLEGYSTWAKCVKVYDGDTITLVFFLHKRPYKFRVRLAGIDTPELRSKDDVEVEAAKISRERLVELIGENLVYIKCEDWDKYGRLLAHIYPDNKIDKSFNTILVDEGHAYNYDGKGKQDFSTWYSSTNN